MLPPEMLGGGTAAERGDNYVGGLAPYRSAGSGRVLRLLGWDNYPHEKLRGVAELGFKTRDRAEQATNPGCSGRGAPRRPTPRPDRGLTTLPLPRGLVS